MQKPILTIVVPCYNEEDVLPETIKQLTHVLENLLEEDLIAIGSKILFVDDGSRDRTWMLIEDESQRNPFVTGIKLSRNFGHKKHCLPAWKQQKMIPTASFLLTPIYKTIFPSSANLS
jgi:polyisoprenyl-phosphate glycosyltransferase